MRRVSYSPGEIGAAFSAGITLGFCTFYTIVALIAVTLAGTEYISTILSNDFLNKPDYPFDLIVNIFFTWCLLLLVVGCCLPQAYAAWDLVFTFHLLKIRPVFIEDKSLSRTLTERHLSIQTKTLMAEAVISVLSSVYILCFSPGIAWKFVTVAWFAQCFILIARMIGVVFVLKYFQDQMEAEPEHDALEQVFSEVPRDLPIIYTQKY